MGREHIDLVIDASGNSSSKLSTLRTDLKNADGAFAKTKVASGALWDGLKANAGMALAAGGTAVVTFATKAIGAFQDTALEAGRFADATGLSADAASRLIEVGGDLGISADTMRGALNKMNLAAENSPAAFDDIGAAIARNKDGTINAEQTFLNAVDAINKIPSSSERAVAAQRIFGKGWSSMAELVGLGADGITTAMAGVEDAKIIDDEEVAKARKFRDVLDALKGAVESVGLVAGEWLVDKLLMVKGAFDTLKETAETLHLDDVFKGIAKAVELWFTPITFAIDKIGDGLNKLNDWAGGNITAKLADDFKMLEPPAATAAETLETVAEAEAEVAAAADEASAAAQAHAESLLAEADQLLETNEALRAASDATYAVRKADRDFAAQLATTRKVLRDDKASLQDKAEALDNAAMSAQDAADADVELARQTAAAKGATISATDAIDIMNDSLIDQAAQATGPTRAALVAHIAQLNGIPPKKASEILALIEEGRLQRAKDRLNAASAARTATVSADARTDAAESELGNLTRSRTIDIYPRVMGLGGGNDFRARAGFIPPGQSAIVGESGVEDVDRPTRVRGPATVRRRPNLDREPAGGPPLIQHFHMAPGLSPAGVLDASRRYARRNGTS